MKQSGVGTWPWAQRTGGTLSRADQQALMNQAMQMQWRRLVGRVTRSFGRKRYFPLTPESLRIPDSPSATRAADLCAQLSPVWLAHHCARTYLYGSLLALRSGISYDEELLYVAAMLHDLGLTPAHWGKDPTAQCFAVEGARAAQAFAREEQWAAQRQDALAEAICLHLNVTVGLAHGAEAHLLQAGASCDVIGAAYRAISPKARALVLERYPRLGFKQHIGTCLREQVTLRPASRIALLHRNFQFGERIAAAPFAE
jgi:hypothetical protein